MELDIRPLVPADRPAWLPLWHGYLAFYQASLAPAITDETWRRILDPAEPVHARGAFSGANLLGIVHFLEHRTCWSAKNVIYLQDLFTLPAARGQGVGRALIERVYAEARACDAFRVYWQTHETNRAAQALYDTLAERSGFIVYRKTL